MGLTYEWVRRRRFKDLPSMSDDDFASTIVRRRPDLKRDDILRWRRFVATTIGLPARHVTPNTRLSALALLCDAGLALQPGDLIEEVMLRGRKRSPADVPDELGEIVVLLAGV
jgi:hypothetical protein